MAACTITLCRNYKGRLKNTKHVTYHRIPIDPIIRDLWINRIRKSRGDATWKPSKTTVVCSDHFRSKDMYTLNNTGRRPCHRLTKGAVPSKALFLSSVKSSESEDSDHIEIAENSNSNEAGPSGICNDVCSSIESSDNFIIKEEDIDILPNNDIPDKTEENSNSNEAGPSGICNDVCSSIESSDNFIIKVEDIDILPNNDIPDKTVEVQNKSELDEEDFSDLDSVYDSPTQAKLRRDLRRKIVLERKHRLKIKSLRQKNQRLQKKIASFKKIIETLKKGRYIDNDIHNSLRSETK